MSSSEPKTPTSRSRQQQAGDAMRQETRRRLLQAAAEEFPAHGYAGTTVTRLATAAGVSVQTLYLVWGSKRALLRGYMEQALAGSLDSPEDASRRFTGLAPRDRIVELAALVTETAERAADGWTLYRDAAAVDAEIAADWNELQMLRHRTFSRVLADLPTGVLADGLTPKTAVDTAWTVASPESFDLLVHRLGYSLAEFRDWIEQTLLAALLAD
jgi:AcrR family transcriptional regulator